MLTRRRYGLRWSSHTRAVAENVTTILHLDLVNNPDRVGDVTAEPFKALPPDPEKCPSAVTANFAVSFSIDATRGGCMRMQTAAQSSDPTEETSGHPWLINKNPQGEPRGETESRFCRDMPG